MTAQVSYLQNALVPHRTITQQVQPTSIQSLAPTDWQTPFVAFVDGSPVLRADWHLVLDDGQALAFVDVRAIPQGGSSGGSDPVRMVAMIAVMVYAPQLAAQLSYSMGGGMILGSAAGLAAMSAGVGLVGMALVNAIIPASKATTPQVASALAAASPTYSMQAQGNTARLEAAIPEHFGRHLAYLDFAAMPYAEYAGNEQYIYQLLCVGRGYYDIEQIRIEDTDISSFDEITYEIVQPGAALTLFPSAVITSSEVAGQDLTTTVSGPFVAATAGTLTNYLAVDYVLARGLYYATDSGALASVSLTVKAEAQAINDYGTATGAWFTLGTETITAATTTPQRQSYRYAVAAGRYQVRVSRLDAEQTDSRYGHDVAWGGLRSYLVDTRVFGDVTLLAMRMRASNNLSTQSSRKVNVIATRKLPVWNGSAWSAPAATRSIAWAFAYAAKAIGRTDAQIDLAALLALDATWASRGDYFDARFDSFLSFWEAATKIAAAGRAKPFVQGGVLRIMRDQAASVPVALYSMRNIAKGSLSVDYLMPTDDTADSINVGYFDNATWTALRVQAVLPTSTSDSPAKIELFGVTGREHAYREGMYQAASNRYRRRLIKFSTEMEGFLPSFGDLIAVQHDMPAWGQGGEVVAYAPQAASTLVYASSAANLIPYPTDLDNAVHSTVNITVAANAATAPDGTLTAEVLTATSTSTYSRIASGAPSLSLSSPYVWSCYVKPLTGTAQFSIYCALAEIKFDLSGLSVSYGANTIGAIGQIEVMDGGWYRLIVRFTTANAGTPTVTNFYLGELSAYPLSGTSAAVWAMRLEAGSVATPHFAWQAGAGCTLTLSEPPQWGSGTHYIGLRKRDGSVAGPYAVTPGASANQVVLASAPSFTPYTGGSEERTHYAFGWADTWRQPARVLSVTPRGLYQVEIEAVAEDDNVHTADQGVVAPVVVTSQLSGYTNTPAVAGLTARSMPSAPDKMLLTWQPSPWADYYLIEQSSDGERWTRTGESSTSNYSATALYGAATIVRVAAVGIAKGPWSLVYYGLEADYMWATNDATLVWDASATTLMWRY